MTNGERAERLMADAESIAEEMRGALRRERWNLATRRAQEVVELVAKALLNQMGVDYPHAHDPVPLLVEAIRRQAIEADIGFLEWLASLSGHLAERRAPAFYQEIVVTEAEARSNVEGAEGALAFGRDLLARLRRP